MKTPLLESGRESVADVQDIRFFYLAFLGREPENDLSLDDRLGLQIVQIAQTFIGSEEFRQGALASLMSGSPPHAPHFGSEPPREICHWAGARLPLSDLGRRLVVSSRSWLGLHTALFIDPEFCRTVSAPACPLACLGGNAQPIDIRFCYQLFLGRDPESEPGQSDRLGLSIPRLVLSFIESEEFQQRVQSRLVVGQPADDLLFASPPSHDICDWAATRLPLSTVGRKRAAAALSWLELYAAIFGDGKFNNVLPGLDSSLACLDGSAQAVDVRFSYLLFLGREPESDPRESDRLGLTITRLALTFIESDEFRDHVPIRLMEQLTAPDDAGSSLKIGVMRDWAAFRLPLSQKGRARVRKASSWRLLHAAVIGDLGFSQAVGDLYADRAGAWPIPVRVQALLVEASGLFERDWYRETYQDVAGTSGDPLYHYLINGTAEGRNPNRLFDTRWYLSAYPDVRSHDVSPLLHYIVEGASQGCRPHPFFPLEEMDRDAAIEDGGDRTPLARFLHDILPFDAAAYPQFTAYDVFRATQSNYHILARSELERHTTLMPFAPNFLVFIDNNVEVALSRATEESLARQIYSRFQVSKSRDEILTIAKMAEPRSTYFLWLDAGDQLADEALYEIASALNSDSQHQLIYFDQEFVLPGRPRAPFHKPNWSPDYLEAFNYIGSAACFELTSAAHLIADSRSLYDFTLRYTETTDKIFHIDRILLSSHSALTGITSEKEIANIDALEKRLARTGRDGLVVPFQPTTASYAINIILRHQPLVSAVIPTAARVITHEGEKIDLIAQCLGSIVETSNYKNIEFIVVDNGDLDRDRLSHVAKTNIRFITYDSPEVNIAAKINLGASYASGEMILILNDDIVPLGRDWIAHMLGHFEKPHVGVVGAKLLYPDGSIQHAGVVACDGIPDHVRRFRSRDDDGYYFSTCLPRNYSAVTGAVSMTRADLFRQIGGYDENFPIDFNDIDFSYKVTAAGLYVVYEPRAELLHYESVSAVKPPRPWDTDHFLSKWADRVVDPFYNEYCLSKHPATFDMQYSERRR